MIESSMINRILDVLEQCDDITEAVYQLVPELRRLHDIVGIYICDINQQLRTNTIIFKWLKNSIEDTVPGKKTGKNVRMTEKQVSELNEAFTGKMSVRVSESENNGLLRPICGNTRLNNECFEVYPSYRDGVITGLFAFSHNIEEYWGDECIIDFSNISRMITAFINKRSSDEASKMKTDFLSRMSHEIRTPMNAIIGMTGIAHSFIQNDERVEDCLNKIDRSTKYLLSLVNDILDMSKIESGKMTINVDSFNMNELLYGIETLIKPQSCESGISFKIIKEYRHYHLLGDELKLNQVIINLVGNALKYTASGGRIILRVEEMLDEDNTIVIRFNVMDNGIGIDEKNMYRIFRAFEQAEEDTARRFGGTGLGLAISSNLIRLMGGMLQVESTLGKGSDFFFTLSFGKITDDTIIKEYEKNHDNAPEKYDFTGKRALIAEDNELNAEISQTVLEMSGFETELAENGKVACDMFTGNREFYYDIVIMDIRMPVMDGFQATKYIRNSGRKDSKSIPIIAMTANAFNEDTKKSIKSGMNGHLSKPVDAIVLYKEIRRIFDSSDT